MTDRIAIAILSFDRPQYLERVIQNVLGQVPFRAWVPDFHLFQDGSTSLRTGAVFGDAEKMAQALAVFAGYLPQGRIHSSAANLGVALNFDRAERTLFEDMGYKAVVFLEDDLLLQPQYFRILEDLLEQAAGRDDIGMVSARGYRNETPMAEQHLRAREVRLMDEHNWAFAMTKAAWAARDAVLRPYLDLLMTVDYRDRDQGDTKEALRALQLSFGRHGRGYLTSQDSMKNLAFEVLGRARVTTFTNNARYIGKEGLHSTADKFAARGYQRTVMYDDVPQGFDIPAPDALRRMRLGLQYR